MEDSEAPRPAFQRRRTGASLRRARMENVAGSRPRFEIVIETQTVRLSVDGEVTAETLAALTTLANGLRPNSTVGAAVAVGHQPAGPQAVLPHANQPGIRSGRAGHPRPPSRPPSSAGGHRYVPGREGHRDRVDRPVGGTRTGLSALTTQTAGQRSWRRAPRTTARKKLRSRPPALVARGPSDRRSPRPRLTGPRRFASRDLEKAERARRTECRWRRSTPHRSCSAVP